MFEFIVPLQTADSPIGHHCMPGTIVNEISNQKDGVGVGEVALWLGTLAAFPEGVASVPSTLLGGSRPSLTSVPGDPVPESCSSGTRHTCGAHIYIHAGKTHVHIKINACEEKKDCVSK